MNDKDIKLPERHEPDGFITDGPFDKPVVINVYRDSTLDAYAREAVRMNASQAENVDQVQALREALDALKAENERLRDEVEALRAEVAETREFREKMANAIGNDQLRRFIEKHGEPVPLTLRVQAAEARAERLAEALEEIRSRSSMNFAMHPDPYELTARLGDIHQIADAELAKVGAA